MGNLNEFLNKLYNQEYFGIYVMIAIIILMIIFLIVFFFGKKDKKKREIEETKKLLQVNVEDTFKEESNPEKVEMDVLNSENELNKEESLNVVLDSNDSTAPVINNVTENINASVNSESLIEESKTDNIETNTETEKPLLDEIAEEPLVINNASELKPNVENIGDIKIPEYDFDSIIEDITKEINIDSKVKEEAEIVEPKVDEEKKEEPIIKEPIKVPSDDELDFELPALKKEYANKDEQIEVPKLNDYDLDNIAGESYNINK